MRVAQTEITRCNRKVKENAHTPVVLVGRDGPDAHRPRRADQVALRAEVDWI